MNENERDDVDDLVDESSDESFPASDPPSWEPLHAGRPIADGPTVENNAADQRFEVRAGGAVGHLQYRYRDDGALVLVHTEVPPALEGRGYAGRLARTALEYAREHSLRVVAQCPFVRAYVARHPEFRDVVVK